MSLLSQVGRLEMGALLDLARKPEAQPRAPDLALPANVEPDGRKGVTDPVRVPVELEQPTRLLI